MSIESRPDRVAFRIAGADATHLLEDVLTCAVREDADAPARWFALLAPQGKILAEGLIGWAAGAHWLDVHESVADNFAKRMRLYKLRAKLEIERLDESHAVGWSAEPVDGGIVHADGRVEGLGWRVIAPRAEAADWAQGSDAALARIKAGIAELGPDFAPDSTFPHDIGMDHLEGVDFKKGCFVGQEVVSRMQHRGTARRRPVIASPVPPQSQGASVTVDERSVGTLGSARAGYAVAIVRIDRIGPGVTAVAGDTPVQLALPDWARYGFADSAGGAED